MNQNENNLLHSFHVLGRAGGGGGRAELDRENAHFVLSETVISTFEQMNCDKDTTEVSDDGDEEDDEEIKRLQMEIKRRRNEKKLRKEKQRQRFQLQSDGVTDTAGTTDQSASPGYSDNDCNHDNTDDILDSNDEDFMEAETKSTKSTDTLTQCSAECIALSLLSQVGSGRLPPVDKLSWLVSRDMVDQVWMPNVFGMFCQIFFSRTCCPSPPLSPWTLTWTCWTCPTSRRSGGPSPGPRLDLRYCQIFSNVFTTIFAPRLF